MAQTPPPVPPVILRGFAHFKTQISATLPTELHKTNLVRRFAVSKLQRGKV